MVRLPSAAQLNVKKFAEAVIPEENVLSTMVPKAILIYKARLHGGLRETV